VDFEDRDRIQEWFLQHATDLSDRLPKAAMSYAIQTSLSGKTIPSFIYNQWHGLPYFQSVMKWTKAIDPSFIQSLKDLQQKVLTHARYQLILSCDQDQYDQLEKVNFYDLQPGKTPYVPWVNSYPLEKVEDQASLIAAPVAFTSLGMQTITSKDPHAAPLLISTELMQNLILHKEIREKGGAYGSGATYTPTTGNFHFYSYRDPHLMRTVQIFHEAVDKIARQEFNERELEEAKLGVIQSLDSPVAPGNRALLAYSWKRQGRTLDARARFRKQTLHATAEDVASSVKHIQGQEETLVSFLGKNLLEKENPPLKITPVF